MNAAKMLYETWVDLKKRQPYHINLIDELHANENAHTRILVKLLQFQNGGNSFILKSFLELIGRTMNTDEERQKLFELLEDFDKKSLPCVMYGKEYIDALIISSTASYAVIIENKIHWACDQHEQIQRYVEQVKQQNVENIFVVYLTANENKKISEDSLTDQAREQLNYTSDEKTGRYVPMTYSSHIIPWLKEEILPSCTIREEWLVSALRQYIDHLEGLLGLRDHDRMIKQKLKSMVSAEAAEDFSKLPENSPEYEFMADFLLKLEYDLEKTFCDEILNNHLNVLGFHNPGGWHPDFGEKWGTVECPALNKARCHLGLEKFDVGFPCRQTDFSDEWSKVFWQCLCSKLPMVHRNQWYWLGYFKLPDTDFCSQDLLKRVLGEERGTRWEQSSILNEKAKIIAEAIDTFYQAVQAACDAADGKYPRK